MYTFTDRHDRAWDVTLTMLGALRIDNSDFSEVFQGPVSALEPSKEFLAACVGKASVMAALCWVIVKPEAEKHEIDENTFIDGFDGPTVGRMKKALRGSLNDFFQGLGIDFLKLTQAADRAEAKMNQMIDAERETIEAGIDAMVEQEFRPALEELKQQLGITSTESPQPRA